MTFCKLLIAAYACASTTQSHCVQTRHKSGVRWLVASDVNKSLEWGGGGDYSVTITDNGVARIFAVTFVLHNVLSVLTCQSSCVLARATWVAVNARHNTNKLLYCYDVL